ncbi:hypothetical protein Q7C_1196 [Methylophaga frappieri]|uniref:Transmembrane protein n=1 Tax=Methylophaga frappieri (strain ATCC BAA-2434 / DSM 25690 / JAM7) TaxID=754477 RepID=I1YHF6_METFJ|nr:DUF2818 family protein [Methylophaga frappieri]AFJ02349.1 hypothetical protein Q7C_1196 [Methylophaga frappieri]
MIWLLVLTYLVLANLPWVNERLFLMVKFASGKKSAWWRLLETLVYYFVALLAGVGYEMQYAGNVYQQDWEFFVTTLSLFLTFSVMGVIYRHQWLPMQKKVR